jgi:hypothetical protein
MNVSATNQPMVKESKNIGGKILGMVALLLSVTFAILQYVFPDPIIYLYSLWRPEYILVLISLLISLLAFGAFIWTYLKNKYLFFITCLLLYVITAFSFFTMGREYYKPQFSDGQPKITAENGSVYYRGVEFSHQFCDRMADTVSCNLHIINKRGQAELRADSWRLVMKDGAVFKDYKALRGGQPMDSYGRLDLPQGVEANIQVIFYNVPIKYVDILKLGFKADRDKFGFKHLSINAEQP